MIAYTNLNAATHISQSQTFSSALSIDSTYIDGGHRRLRGTVKRRQVVYPPVMRTKADGLRPVRDSSYLGQPARLYRAGLAPAREACHANSTSSSSLFDEHLAPLLARDTNILLKVSQYAPKALKPCHLRVHYTDLI